MKPIKRGFTLVELLVVISIIALLISILLPALNIVRGKAQQAKDSTQIRGVLQGMQSYASGDRSGAYPVPSSLDRSNVTEDPDSNADYLQNNAVSKNRTGAVLSYLLFQRFVDTADVFVSPAEVNSDIRVPTIAGGVNTNATDASEDSEFNFVRPPAAASVNGGAPGEFALWDPKFTGTPDDPALSGSVTRPASMTAEDPDVDFVSFNSYAHIPVGGHDLEQFWGTVGGSDVVILGNRGPLYQDATGAPRDDWELVTAGRSAEFGIASNTIRIHGPRSEWRGGVAYNDGRVEFFKDPNNAGPRRLRGTDDEFYNDNIFALEQTRNDSADFSSRTNIYMRAWSRGLTASSGGSNRSLGLLAWTSGINAYVD